MVTVVFKIESGSLKTNRKSKSIEPRVFYIVGHKRSMHSIWNWFRLDAVEFSAFAIKYAIKSVVADDNCVAELRYSHISTCINWIFDKILQIQCKNTELQMVAGRKGFVFAKQNV